MQLYKIVRYVIRDLLRSRWTYVYFAFYYLLGMVLLFINHDLSKAIITLMNIITILTPLIGTVFGVMYYYSSREFIQLLLAQPLRRQVVLGRDLGFFRLIGHWGLFNFYFCGFGLSGSASQ